jgi:hypothetical protein
LAVLSFFRTAGWAVHVGGLYGMRCRKFLRKWGNNILAQLSLLRRSRMFIAVRGLRNRRSRGAQCPRRSHVAPTERSIRCGTWL